MAAAGAVWLDVLPSMAKFGPALEKGGSSAAGSTGKKMAKILGGAIAAGFATVKFGSLIKEAANLDNQMREVVTLFGETGTAADKSLGEVSKLVRGLSDEFGIAQSTLTGGLYQAISAGVPRENALTFMQIASRAAIGGVTDVETAVDGLTTVINAFGLNASDAEKVSDSLFTAVKGGKTNFAELSASLFQVAPSAAAAGVSFQEVNAALATITSAGTPTAVATTRVRAAIDELAKPGTKVSQIFQQIAGKDFRTFIAEGGNLQGALGLLQGEAERTGAKIGDYFGSVEAGGAATTLAVTGAAKFAEEMKNQANAAGATAAAFDVVNEGAQRKFETAMTRIKNIGISAGAAVLPVLVRFAEFISERVIPAVTGFVDSMKPAFEWAKRNADIIKVVAAVLGAAVAALVVYQTTVGTVTKVTQTWTKVKALLNGTLALNPIGLVVVALVALGAGLVVAYKQSDTFREIVQRAWKGVQDAVSFAWDRVIKPALDALVGFLKNPVSTTVNWLWQSIIKPAFEGISAIVKGAWDRALKPTLEAVVGFVRSPVATTIEWLWQKIFKPAFDAMGWIVQAWWAVAELVFAAAKAYVEKVLAPVFTWLYEKAVKPAFDAIAAVADWLWQKAIKPVFEGIKSTITTVWEQGIRPVFQALGDFISDKVAPAFKTGVDAIGKAWEAVKNVAKAPVRFIIETVINKGIIGTFNKVADFFGTKQIAQLQLPVGFADGGWTGPGGKYAPAGVVHADEFVIRKESQRAMRAQFPGLLDHINRTGSLPGYWAGGLVDKGRSAIGKGVDVVTNAAKSVMDLLTDPTKILTRVVDGMLGGIGSSPLAKMLTAVPRKLVGAAAEKIKSLFGGAEGIGGSAGGGGLGWQWQINTLRQAFPGLPLNSGYRPGSVTATGNPSWHGRGRAVDVPPRMDVFNFIRSAFGKATKELIFSPAGGRQLKNGQPHVYTGVTKAMHYDHVHWAYDQGGWLQPGRTQVYNGTKQPEAILTAPQWNAIMRGGIGEKNFHLTVSARDTVNVRDEFHRMQLLAGA